MKRNERLLRQVAKEFGATIALVRNGAHQQYVVTLPDGTAITHGVAKGLRNDEFKIKQWARQRIRQAVKAAHNGSV